MANTKKTQTEKESIKLPSKEELVNIMKNRGYTLVYEAPNKTTLMFSKLNGKDTGSSWNVTVFADKNCFAFNTIVNPGIIKMNTDFFTGVDDDSLFNEIEQYIKDVLTKLYANT